MRSQSRTRLDKELSACSGNCASFPMAGRLRSRPFSGARSHNNTPYTAETIEKIADSLAWETEFLSRIEKAERKHILPLLDHGEHDDAPVAVLPLADRSLAHFFEIRTQQGQSLKPADLLRWFEQIAIGLDALHSIQMEEDKPYVHRDIKYDNVMLWNGRAFLSDFGTVKRVEHSLTQSLAGTLSWAAPEMLLPKEIVSGEPSYEFGPPADIYSLGLIVYGLVTGNFPSCQRMLLTKVDDNGYPLPGAEQYFWKIGGLTEHERDLLVSEAQSLFVRPGVPLTQQGCMPLPDRSFLADRLVSFIRKLLAPDVRDRLTAKQTVVSTRELSHFHSPRLESLEIEVPDEITIGNSFEVLVRVQGRGLPSYKDYEDEDYEDEEYEDEEYEGEEYEGEEYEGEEYEDCEDKEDEENRWLCVTVEEKQPYWVVFDGDGVWRAYFPPFYEQWEHNVSAWAVVNGNRIKAEATLRVKDPVGQLWDKGQHTEALISDPNRPEWHIEIHRKAEKGKTLGYWISVLDEVRKKHPDNEEVNYLYWKLRKKRNETFIRSQPRTLSVADVKKMLVKHNFFDSKWNESGDFKNDFVKSRDGETVRDRATGLMWQQSGSMQIIYKKKQVYFKELNGKRFAGYSDWRLPTIEELMSLMERKEVNNLYIDPVFVFGSKQVWCWSADKRPSGSVWFAFFIIGGADWSTIEPFHYVLAVRS